MRAPNQTPSETQPQIPPDPPQIPSAGLHRVGDKRIIRLVRKWLKAGILEDGVVTVDDRGTGQGSVISPLLANIYLHYCLDLWADRWRRREAQGDMVIVRYADDLVVGFEYEDDARRFLDAMRTRLEEFSLSLHPDKTRLIEFGRHAAARAVFDQTETSRHCERPLGRRARGEAIQAATAAYDHWIASSLRFS